MKLILASGSPRRRELLERFGLPFLVLSVDTDESVPAGTPAVDAPGMLSRRKADAAFDRLGDPDALILAADTVVVCDGALLGKPTGSADAARMLRLLSGRTHEVVTGITLRRGDRCLTRSEQTLVRFLPLSEENIAAYIASGEPMDKAGAYGIQGLAAAFIPEIRGDYFNVMGLPLCLLSEMLREFGTDLLGGVL